jgi:hypothetical protein
MSAEIDILEATIRRWTTIAERAHERIETLTAERDEARRQAAAATAQRDDYAAKFYANRMMP